MRGREGTGVWDTYSSPRQFCAQRRCDCLTSDSRCGSGAAILVADAPCWSFPTPNDKAHFSLSSITLTWSTASASEDPPTTFLRYDCWSIGGLLLRCDVPGTIPSSSSVGVSWCGKSSILFAAASKRFRKWGSCSPMCRRFADWPPKPINSTAHFSYSSPLLSTDDPRDDALTRPLTIAGGSAGGNG
jgi:hypothetical protein